MLDTRMKTFMMVAEKRNFSKAAAHLHISQPAVSVQIQQLEKDYGAKLFKRYEKEISLTPAGQILLGYAYRLAGLADEAVREINRLENQVKGPLRLGATLTVGEYLLPSVIGAFKLRFPQVEFLLEVANTQTIENMLLEHNIDLALVEGPLTSEQRLEQQELMSDELLVVFSPGHQWVGNSSVTWDQLLNEKLILREPGSGTRKVFENAVLNMGKQLDQLNIFMQMGSTQAIKALIKENLGVTVLSKLTVQEELELGSLRGVRLAGCTLSRSFRFVTIKEHLPTLVCEHFIDFCRKYVSTEVRS